MKQDLIQENSKANLKIIHKDEKTKLKKEKAIRKYIKSKELEFSFEVKQDRQIFPEIEEIKVQITKGDEAVALFLRAGKMKEAKELKNSLEQARYEIEMLDSVMNLDFTKPRAKAKEMADEMGIDLTDPVVVQEFQKMQQNRLIELKNAKEGKRVKEEDKEEYVKEDYNDVFRESNRAVENLSDYEDKLEPEEEKKEQPNQDKNQAERPNNNLQQKSKLDDEEDENAFSPKIIIGIAII